MAHRLFYDYCVNGFLMNDNIYRYGTDIHCRPEFILDLVKLFPNLRDMECEWLNSYKSYRIDFIAYINQIERFTFSLDEYRDPPFEDWDEMSDEQKLKKWMLSYALDRAFDEMLGEEFLYVRSNISIPPNRIISCTEIPDSFPNNSLW